MYKHNNSEASTGIRIELIKSVEQVTGLLTLGAHAQRGLRYLSGVFVC